MSPTSQSTKGPKSQELARVLAEASWILPRQSLWSSIVNLVSPIVANLVFSSKVCVYVVLGFPLLVCPCCGYHNTSFNASSYLCLTQCPAILIRLSMILLEMFGR